MLTQIQLSRKSHYFSYKYPTLQSNSPFAEIIHPRHRLYHDAPKRVYTRRALSKYTLEYIRALASHAQWLIPPPPPLILPRVSASSGVLPPPRVIDCPLRGISRTSDWSAPSRDVRQRRATALWNLHCGVWCRGRVIERARETGVQRQNWRDSRRAASIETSNQSATLSFSGLSGVCRREGGERRAAAPFRGFN